MYVGNPLLDEIADFIPNPDFRTENHLSSQKIIALLPGSRKQEVNKMLPIMLEATKKYSDYQLVIAGAPGLNESFYKPYLTDRLKIVFGQTYDLLNQSTAAIVCSGTATLETALFNIPQVCGYAANPISYAIAKLFVKVKYISLVNLCMDKPCITELIQQDMNPQKLQEELELIMPDGKNRVQLLNDYADLKKLLGDAGASDRAAKIITILP
jgi:lipid-A-disaccharide synthase